MKRALFALAFSTLALGAASAKSYSVTLFRPAVIAGTEVKPGDYRIDIKEDKIVLKGYRVNTELDASLETAPARFDTTSVRFEERDGKSHVQEIRLGGTDKKIMLGGTGKVVSGGTAAAPLPR